MPGRRLRLGRIAVDLVRLRAAAVVAIGLLGASITVLLAQPPGAPPVTPTELLPALWSAALLCVAGLSIGRAPSVAWLATIGAMVMAATAIGSVAVAVEAQGLDRPSLVLAPLYRVALISPVVAAAVYAAPRSRGLARASWTPAAAWTAALVLAAVLLVGLVQRMVGVPTALAIGVSRAAWLVGILAITGLGVVVDVAPAVGRTRDRLSRPPALAGGDEPAPGTGPGADAELGSATGRAPGRAPGRRPGPLLVLRTFVDELLPGRREARVDATEAERRRLAADLHAEVLPPLRRALASAERGGDVERLAADLRSAVADIEELLARRRSIVLEELGLVPALEWLAERVEERSDTRIGIAILDPDPGERPARSATATHAPAPEASAGGGESPGRGRAGAESGALDRSPADPGSRRPPRAVERAAFRVAQLALDNVTRHAPSASVRILVRAGPSRLLLTVEDDGPGLGPSAETAVRAGHRGLADMRAEAEACGARLAVGAGASGQGVVVTFDWPA